MSDSRRARTVRRLTGGVLLAACVGLAFERAGAQQGSAGANVNVISGTGADGDWTLQRQNEPSMACSSRNPQNCLAGANDYRTVDIPFPTSGEKVTGDAWLGWYTTKNGGLAWRTRLLPGYPQDVSPAGIASPLKGYAAGADPIIRPGTNGMFYYGGLVFNRDEGGGSAIFVARFIDNNNQEGVAGEPIGYLGASVVHRIGAAPAVVARRQGRGERPATRLAGRSERNRANREKQVRAGVEQAGGNQQLVDKPWMAVDVPRAGAATCSIGGPGTGMPLQTFPGGNVYMAYALFDDPGEQRGRIMFSRSTNCGTSWSPPRPLSRIPSADVNDDGVATTADITRLQLSAGRSCGHASFNPNADTNNDCTVNALDLNFVARGVGLPVPRQPRLSQGATLAIDAQSGAVQVAWRQFNDGVLSDAIVTARSTNGGAAFGPPTVVATLGSFDQGTTDTSFRTNGFPTMAFDAAGRAYLAWSARGYATQRPDPAFGDARIVMSTSTNGTTWSMPTAVDNVAEPGHQIMPALAFAQGKLQLVYYDLREDVSQLFGQYVDELPILSGAHLPRVRHTIDVRAAQADPGPSPSFAAFRLSQYRSGGVPGSQTVQQLEFNPPNLPIFRAGTSPFMGDYLDVATEAPFVRNGSTWSFNTAAAPSPVFHGIWTDNRDIRPPANGLWTDYTPPNPPFARPAMSGFDPTQPIPACVPGQAGMRNQNIYTARITRGLVVGAVGNSRRLGSIQRSFPVFAQNNGTTIRSYRLTITNQPVGGQASFKQFEQLTTLDVEVPRRSTVARTVFARSTDPHAPINVSVVEISAPGGAPVAGGQQGTIALNPDPTNPDLENPDLENPDLENPDLENAEVHNPDLENATTRNPDLENPDLENPDLENPDLENTSVANPSIINPDLENPDLENPDLENPDLENPDLENPDLENGALSDTTWTVTNKGNTASSYTVRLALNRQLPAGFTSQLLAHKIYQTPAALGCSLLKQSQTVLLANIPNPRFVTGAELANPDLENPDLENLTIVIAPGETARITLRVFDPIKTDAITFRAAESVTPVAVAQAVNTPEADAGVTQPAAAGVLTSSAPVPGGTSGGDYTTTLTSTLPGTWTVAGGTVPPGLTVDPNTGAVTGTPTTTGTYTFTARFQSTIGIIDYRTVTITVGAVGAAANVGVAASAPAVPVSIGTPFAYTLNVSNAGPAPATTVRVTDTLPEGTAFVSATTTAGSCQQSNGTLVCNLGTLASGSAATITLTVRPTVGGTHTNTAVVTAAEADHVATNNSAVGTASTLVTVTPCTTVCFSGPTSYIAGPNDLEFGAEKGDFNEDGFVDLVYGPVGVNTVGIVLGNGAGGFGPPSLMTIPGSPDAGAVADFNNDGHLDIVISSQGIAQAWVFLGNGLGQFAAPAIIALPNTPENVVAADFNRDGNADMALAGNGPGPLVIILHGNGNGTFQPPTTIGTTTTLSSIQFDDFNNDGNLDLAVHVEQVGLTTILGNGPSGFQPPTTIPLADISGVIKTGDLTGDGLADLIIGAVPPTGAELRLYVGNGAGGFTQSVMIGDPELTDDAPAVGDFDSDGDLDVVWARSGGGVGIQLNNGSGTFAAPIYLSSPQTSQPIVADFNGDGRPDLALPIGRAFQSQFLVFLNTCDQPAADLSVTLVGPTDPVAEGDGFAYNIDVTNNGPNPATGVQLDFTFGAIAEFVAIGGSPGSCSVVRNRLTCQLGTLASAATSSFTVVLRSRAGGSLSSTAGVTGTTSDPNPANNAAFTTTTITPGASTLVVTNTNESGPGSLFQAIFEANDPGPRDTITFNIPGGGPHTIRPTTRNLPNINAPVVIDGTTQPGYAGTPLIEISGENAGPVAGLFVNTSNTVIRGLAINRFNQAGIALGGAGGHTVEANFIGTNSSGTAALPNQTGVFVDSPNNVIGGTTPAVRNVISGNTFQGVIIPSAVATGNVVAGNFIGTNVDGTADLGNGAAGIVIQSAGNTIGGTTPGSRNLISGNNNGGVNINGTTAAGNVVVGNLIGTNVSASAAIANGNNGINISNGAANNTVGGSSAAARNIISGNLGSGVRIQNVGTTGNAVRGNYVGTNAAGTAAIPNGVNGVEFGFAASGNTAGGLQPADGNLISGNTGVGVGFFTVGPGGNQALSNLIGTDVTGTLPLGNGTQGVIILSDNNRVGSLTSTIGNVIAFNGANGVQVDSGTGNAIVNNRIFSNGSLGIDLAPLGVTANDAGDTDTGANNLLNRPVLSSARTVGANILVQVDLSPTPSGPFQVHLYANAACDASGSGEGATPIGVSSFGVGSGDTRYEAIFNALVVPAGSFLTATATDSTGNTSEFSACAQVSASAGTANLGISKQDSPDPVTVGSPLTYLISVSNAGPDASSNATVTDVLPATVTLVSANASAGSCTGTTTVTCTLGSIASGSQVTVGIVVTPTAAGPLSNTATVSASGTDPDTANNSATTTTTVVAVGPSTFVVTNTNDSGAGSLRQAILDANARPGMDMITFAIPPAGPFVRTIFSLGLPTISDPITIDGTTQAGYSGTPIIELSGAEAPAGANGLVVSAADSMIRGLIINRWTGSGVVLQGPNADSVVGNWIGTASNGTSPAGNGNGILILSSQHLIGGSTAAERNVISGNTIGVNIGSPSARGNAIVGNYIGTDLTGTLDVGNTDAGVVVLGEINAIGGSATGNGNLISGNNQAGVRLAGGAPSNTIEGNRIGTDVTGVNPLPNLVGVSLGTASGETASSNTVGGQTPGSGNLIAFNTTTGVSVIGGSTNNAIWGNAIRDNGTLGIDLNADGVSANDPGDADEGANDRINFPVLTTAAGGVQGTLNSIPNTTFRIEFFGNTACDASGNGEGATFLGATTVTTDGAGNATIPLFTAAAGQFVTATATDSSNNTSEFSSCVTPLAVAAEIAVGMTDSPDPVIVGGQLAYTVTITNNGPSPATNVRLGALWNGPFNVDATSPSGTCELTPLLTCSLGTLASGATATLTIVGTPTAIGSLSNTVTVQADEADPVPANNAVAVSTSIVGGPSSFIVTSTSNTGAGSLRQAILNANASVGADVIGFAIPGAGVQTITLATPLPAITDPLTIDGTTQPTFTGTPVIELNGNGIVGNGLTVSAANTTIRGLVINRFVGGFSGISIGLSATNTVVQGNYVGTNAAGTAVLPNSAGITIASSASGALIGGTAPGTGNLISGNSSHGVSVQTGALNATIRGNLIGLDQSGTAPLANSGFGIQVGSSGATIGGTQAEARNVIAGNGFCGISLNTGSSLTTIQGNFVGTNVSGTAAVPNALGGICLIGSSNNTIGGTAGGAGNLISGNGQYGIRITDLSLGNIIQGNLIGTSAAGTAGVPNGGDGISVFDASNTLIGGGTGNTIRFNNGAGVRILAGSTGNRINGNSISDNGQLGINLGGTTTVTANDTGDADSGPNNLQNFPVLTAAAGAVQGTLNSAANGTFRIEFFGNTACDSSGNGEGATFLGSTSVTTDTTGNAAVPLFAAATGQFVTATATDSSNNTSEFSACELVAAASADLALSKTDSPDPVVVGSPLTYTITVTNNGPGSSSGVTVTDQLSTPSVSFVSASASQGTCTGTPVVTCSLGTLASGGAATVTIVVTPTVPGTVNNTATVTAATNDPNPNNNGAVISTTVANVPQTFAVTNTADAGAGSLRAAITAANADPATADSITFNIPGTGPFTIAPASALPTLTGPVSIDGTTQPGFAGAPIVELNGANAGAGTNGLAITGGSSILRGLVINRFQASGILITGSAAIANQVVGNYIGTNASGTAALGNTQAGVTINGGATDNVVGGTAAQSRNVLSGNGGEGVVIFNPGTSRNVVLGNFIGTDVTGTIDLGNALNGVGISVGATSNIIGGTTPGARNLISGNQQVGVGIFRTGTNGNVIQGNYIGTDVTGTVALGNSQHGVLLSIGQGESGPAANTIGGRASGAGNLVSGNLLSGIVLMNVGTTSNVVQGNFVGTTASGTTPLPNVQHGILIASSANGNAIGGALAGAGNVVAFNGGAGVAITLAEGNAILNNSIFSNSALGIDLGNNGITANDPGDIDTGANSLQNFPVLTGAVFGVQGTLNSTPGATFYIEFFLNQACDASGNGEGATFLTTTTVTTDGAGNATIPLIAASNGQLVTATATDSSNNTSEFSACVQAGVQPSLAGVSPDSAAQGATLDVTLTGANTSFASGVTTVGFGAVPGITVNSLTVNSPTSATANITISPTAFTGGRTVTVTTGAEVVTNAFAVTAGPASLSLVNPTSAVQGQSNLNITVTGQNSHFAQNLTTASFGSGIVVNLVTVTSATSATVNVSLQDFAAPGLRTVTLTTDGENATLVNGFTVIAGTPRLTQVNPAVGQQGTTLGVAATGQFTNFVSGTTTADFGAGITVNTVSVTSATAATVNITISPLASAGNRTVTLTTGNEIASTLAGSFFTVTAGTAAIANVSPSSGRQAESLGVTITGSNTHFASGSTTFSFGGDIIVTSLLINSPTSATLQINVGQFATLGARSVTATTLGEVATNPGAFTVTAGLPAVSTVSPSTGRQAETLNLNVVGQFTQFVNGTTTASVGAGIAVNSVSVIDATHATLNITVSPGAGLGSRTVIMTTGSEIAQQIGGFTVTPGQPTLFSINPVSAVQGTSATVILNGAFTNFANGLTSAFFGAGISAGTVTVNGPTLASVPITIFATATSGPRSVTVSTGSEVVTLTNGFTVVPGVPAIMGIDPNAGQRGLTRNVSITGAFTNWQSGITSVSYGPGITVNTNGVASATSITTNITIDPDAALGPRDVVITTGSDVQTVPGGFLVTDLDGSAPLLLTISPPYGAAGVPLNTAVTAEFNEPINRSTVTTATFQVYDTFSGQFIAGTVSVDATGRVATFVPTQLLAVNRQHGVYLNAPITDVAGNPLGFGASYFNTGFSTDTTGPTLRLTNPQNGDAGVGRNVKVELQFDRAINAATVGIGVRVQAAGVTVPGTYALEDGQRRIRFTPANLLAADTTYTVVLTNQLRDLAGNSVINPGTFVFTTGAESDTTYPTVVSSTPAYFEDNVGRLPVIRVAFSETIDPISVNSSTFYLYNTVTGGYVRATTAIAPDRRSATLRPDAPLEPYSYYLYYVSFSDQVGNTGGSGGTYFRTGAGEDTVPPTVVALDPGGSATNVPVNARVRAVMSEAIDATFVPASSIQLTPAVAGTLELAFDRLSLLFTPVANLAVSTTYMVQISGLRDSSGNVMAPVSSTFTTSASPAADTTAPTIVGFTPANNATNVAVGSPIVMTVSEPIRTSGLAEAMRVFVYLPTYGYVQLAGSYSVNPAATIVTFTPAVPYPGGGLITVYTNYTGLLSDLAGNPVPSTAFTFTTAPDADTTAPTVVMVTPTDGSTGIGSQAVVTLTFSEPLLPSTVTNDTIALFAGAVELSPSINRSADNTTVFLTATMPFDATITVFATSDVTDVSGNALADFSSTFTTGSTIQTIRPQIVTQRPTGPGIPADTDITLFVNRPLNESTVAGALYVSQNGVLVEGVVTVTGGGTAIHFNPAANFAPAAAIQVFMTGAAQDAFGNSLYDYSGSFTVSPDTTTQAPTIVRTSPVAYSFGVPTSVVIDIEFSEPLAQATVTSTNIFVLNLANQPIAGTLSLSNDGRVARFTPSAPFAPNDYNYVYLTNGLRDLQNTPFVATSFYINTGVASDSTAPAVTSVAPPNGATDIGVNAVVRLSLSEAVNPLTVTASTLSLSSISGPIPASVTFNPANTLVTLVPQIPLPASTMLTLTIAGVQDPSRNAIAAQTVQFTTGASADTVQPSVISTNVTAYAANNVPTNTVFTLTFDEPMDAATVLSQTASFLYDGTLGFRPGSGTMSSDGRTFTFVPDSPLAVNRGYSLYMYSGYDLAGNPQVGFYTYFTTTFASDTTPPAVSGVNPVSGSTNMPRNARVEIRFSESVSDQSLGNVRLLTNGGTPVPVTRILSDTNRMLTLRPNGLLASNRNYTISVNGVRDTSGNTMAAPFTSTFTTGSRSDLVAPTITATSPAYDDRGVGLNMVGRMVFSEPIDPLSVNAQNVLLTNVGSGSSLDVTIVIAADRRSVTITPNAPLLPYTYYFMQLYNFTDVAGNAGAGTYVYFYTGDSVDVAPPAVAAMSPPNGSTGLPVNTRVTVVMSEAIDVTSVSNASIQVTPAAAGVVTLSPDRITLTFVPSGNLAPSTAYSILVSGLRDAASNTMAPATFGFTTGASGTPDTTAPAIVGRTPTNNAAGIGVTSAITFTTSERITATAVGPSSVPVYAVLSGVGTFQLAGVYSVDATGTVVTFTVTGAFPANATIQWYTNSNGTIRDMAGLALPSEFAQFTTANTPDTSGPTVQTVTPTNGATNVGRYAVVTLTFSESVNPNTVNNNTVALFAGPTRLSASLGLSLDNRMVFLAPTLPADSTITVVVTSGVTDLSGNALAAFTSTFTTSQDYDFSRPSVVTQRPTGSGVSRTTPITLFLNQPVDPASVPAALFVSQNGVLVAGTVSVNGSNQAITFTPTAPFAAFASVDVALTTAARDFAGNQVNTHFGTFAIENDGAATAPVLTRTTPVQYSSGNPTNAVVELEFSEPLNPATVLPANVFVRDALSATVSGTLSLRAGNRVIRFTPDAAFAASNYTYVYYTGGLLDLQGSAVAASSFYFYTGTTGDSTSPSVTAVAPLAGTSGVGINGSIRIRFSEAINPISISPATVTISAGNALGATFTLGGGNTLLTVSPQRPLPPGTLVTITVSGVEDVAGNAVPVTTSSFTTGNAPDTSAPVLIATSIVYGQVDVPINSSFEWSYSEPIDATTVTEQQNVLYDYTVGFVPGGTLSVNQDSRTVTFVSPANLVPGRQYQIYFGSVADLAGNVGGGFSLYFTASTAADTTPPQVLAVTPGSGAAGVPLNARVRIAFDETVSATSLANINLLVSGTPLVVTSRTLSDSDRVVTLTLGGLLAPSVAHTISIAGVRDRAGNALTPPVTRTFTTGTGIDLVGPAGTVTTSPPGGATGVAVGASPSVTFSEAIDPASVLFSGASGVTLQVVATGVNVPVVYSFSTDLRTVTLTPATPLASGTQYYLQVWYGVADVAGNTFPTVLQFLFTTQP